MNNVAEGGTNACLQFNTVHIIGTTTKAHHGGVFDADVGLRTHAEGQSCTDSCMRRELPIANARHARFWFRAAIPFHILCTEIIDTPSGHDKEIGFPDGLIPAKVAEADDGQAGAGKPDIVEATVRVITRSYSFSVRNAAKEVGA